MASSNSVPRRSDLLDQLNKANRFAWLLVQFEIVLIAIVSAIIDWNWVQQQPVLTTVAIGTMVCPTAFSIVRYVSVKKVRIQDLKESTRFGSFDKYRLQTLFRDTLSKLHLPDEGLSVYIVASRSINAAAMHVGLGSFFKSLNGIYLNRQALHKLEPTEIQDLMGHELGHYYKHYLVTDRYRMVTIVLGSLVGIFAAQHIEFDSYFGYIFGYLVLTGVPALFWMLSSLPHAKNSQAIEFLCDDFGAHVGGVLPSIHGLLKLGLDAELECVVMQQAVLSKLAGNFNPSELIETISGAIPYGHASREEIEDKVNRELRNRAAERKMSIGGLLNYMWNSEAEADAAEQLAIEAKKMRKLQSEPRMNWESLLPNSSRIEFSENGISNLVELLESRTDEHLFRIPEAPHDAHPTLRSRILYLWHNRSEIESQSRT
ncbi:MAG: M48 family metalloprotease [Pirellulaceae bacterium]|nr:M48 family metalloprotease [Pirellulaceae bacterium]